MSSKDRSADPILFCSGGCRSGKSAYAQAWIEARSAHPVYIATAYISDAEMAERVKKHQAARGGHWRCLEPLPPAWMDPEGIIAQAAALGDGILFDCLTLWVSACLDLRCADSAILGLAERMAGALRRTGLPVALVSNELGMGLVPEHALSRYFRDIAGLVNQRMAACADEAVFLVSGLPLVLKS